MLTIARPSWIPVFLTNRLQGLAPLIVREVFEVIAGMRREGMSVLLVEQNVRAAVDIADTACVLDDGRVVFTGPASDFGSDEARVRALAGASVENWDVPDAGNASRDGLSKRSPPP